jgi:predicted Zn-dependent protease with MMP-like domain
MNTSYGSFYNNAYQQDADHIISPILSEDGQQQVDAAVKQYNAVIREHLRSETGLRLATEHDRRSVPVEVSDGYPIALARLIVQNADDIILWILLQLQHDLHGAKNGLESLLKHWRRLCYSPLVERILHGKYDHVETTLKTLDSLLRIKTVEKLRFDIIGLSTDILGAYFPEGRFLGDSTLTRTGPCVQIYWKAIDLFAKILGVGIQELTVVTLTHELAHAYTHLGQDIDSRIWKTEYFLQAEDNVLEGLAQFYTHVITKKMDKRLSKCHEAYQALLRYQPAPYHAHTTWFVEQNESEDQKLAQHSETVRFALLRGRGSSRLTDNQWRLILAETHRALYGERRVPSDPDYGEKLFFRIPQQDTTYPQHAPSVSEVSTNQSPNGESRWEIDVSEIMDDIL